MTKPHWTGDLVILRDRRNMSDRGAPLGIHAKAFQQMSDVAATMVDSMPSTQFAGDHEGPGSAIGFRRRNNLIIRRFTIVAIH